MLRAGYGFSRLGLVLGIVIALAGCGKKEGLRVTRLEPKTGPYSGGSACTIFGSGFQSGGVQGVKVYFGDKEARVLGFSGDTELKVEPPPGDPNQTVNVTLIFDDARELTYEKAYTYIDSAGSIGVDKLIKPKE